MSRAAKIFLGSSVLFSVGTIWGVHYIQKRESDTMYQGVIKDEERMRQRALAAQAQAQAQSQSSSPSSPSIPTTIPQTTTTPLNTPGASFQHPITPPPPSTSTPPVTQPPAVIDPDCPTCIISPPPELVQAQSAEQRASERRERMLEYEAQRRLAGELEREQGGPGRIV